MLLVINSNIGYLEQHNLIYAISIIGHVTMNKTWYASLCFTRKSTIIFYITGVLIPRVGSKPERKNYAGANLYSPVALSFH